MLFPAGMHELAIGEFCIVGRGDGCDIRLDDGLISRRHLHIFAMTDRVILTDLMSSNGVYVNGIRVDGGVRLCAEDRILVGTTELSVF